MFGIAALVVFVVDEILILSKANVPLALSAASLAIDGLALLTAHLLAGGRFAISRK